MEKTFGTEVNQNNCTNCDFRYANEGPCCKENNFMNGCKDWSKHSIRKCLECETMKSEPTEKESNMKKHCGLCKKAGCNTGIPCGHTFDTCCDVEWKYWHPIEPKPQAEDYKMLRKINLSSLLNDHACDEAILWYCRDYYIEVQVFIIFLTKVIKKHPEWLPWLIENKYIQLKQHKPEAGDVYECQIHGKAIIIEGPWGKTHKALHCATGNITQITPYPEFGWEFKGNLKDRCQITY